MDEYNRIMISTVLDEFGLNVIPARVTKKDLTKMLFTLFIEWTRSITYKFSSDAEMLTILGLVPAMDANLRYRETLWIYSNWKELARISPNHGFLHNVLLAHPDIDSTIEDSQHNDLIKLSKYRTINLRDNPRAFTEMARAHLRFMKIDAVKGSSKNQKHIALAAISSLIIGSASIGIIRWMI